MSLRQVDLERAWDILKQVRGEWVIAALISVVLNHLLKTWRWQYIAASPDFRLSFRNAFASLMVGQWLNALLPLRIGDIARAYLVAEDNRVRVNALGTIGVEKYLDLAMLFSLLALCLRFLPMPPEIQPLLMGLGWFFILFSVFMLFVLWKGVPLIETIGSIVEQKLSSKLADVVKRFGHALVSSLGFFRQGIPLFLGLCLTFAVWLSAWLNNQLTLFAINGQLPWEGMLLLLVLLMAGVSIPSAPGKVGVFEYIVVFTLGLFDVEGTFALSYAVLLHAIVYVPVILLGAWAIAQNRPGRQWFHPARFRSPMD